MEKRENGKSSGKRTVKDLTVKSVASVKGGTIADTATASLVKACTNGAHFPEVVIHL